MDIVILPTVQSVSKIDVYKNANGEEKVSLIGDYYGLSIFIDVNLSLLQCKSYMMRNIKLLDVRHGSNRVVVLGQFENGKFALLSHDKNNVQNYTGYLYQTPQLYPDDSVGIYHYLLEMYRERLDNIAIVGYSAMDDMSGTTISMIKLDSMNVIKTQAVDRNREVRSKFKDMKIDYTGQHLLCLIENPVTGFNDNMFVLLPMYNSSYNTEVAIMDSNDNSFKSLVPYIGSYGYMALGKNNNNVIFFDEIQSLNLNFDCADKDQFRVDVIERIQRLERIYYEGIISIPIDQDIFHSTSALSTYSIICQ